MQRESKRAKRTPPLPADEELRRRLISTIDSVLAGECSRRSAAQWAEEQLRSYSDTEGTSLLGAGLSALSFVDYEHAPLEVFADHLRSIQDALEGRSDYVVSMRFVPREEMERLMAQPGGARDVKHLDSERG